MNQNYDDTFLARWLSDELSEKELKAFQDSDDFVLYQQVRETMDTAQVSEFDVDKNLQKTLTKLQTSKKRKVIPLWSYAAAASILVLFFVYNFFFSISNFSTGIGEQLSYQLPDNSEVILNAVSTSSFKKYKWNTNRTLNLEGEAYFKVEKGSTFSVVTNQGIVQVLGTQFLVTDRKDYFAVTCFEGKVQVVTVTKDSIVLEKGTGIRFVNNKINSTTISDDKPSWLSKESSFENVPLLQVINELERQYSIDVLGKENLKISNFTGRFPHENLEKALNLVFGTMDIKYKKDTKGNVVILED